jgi:uridine kinase
MDQVLTGICNYIKDQNQKLLIGISGHGAAGKTHFTTELIKHLDSKKVNYMNTDPYIVSNVRRHAFIDYEYNGKKHHYKMTACHPFAHHVFALERDLKMIRAGLDLYTIGTPYTKSHLLSSQNKVNLIEGMTVSFVNPDLFDLTIYLYSDGDTEFRRRSIRDVSERGANINDLKQSHQERRIQYELFMHSYHKNFDIVIRTTNDSYIIEKNNLINLEWNKEEE